MNPEEGKFNSDVLSVVTCHVILICFLVPFHIYWFKKKKKLEAGFIPKVLILNKQNCLFNSNFFLSKLICEHRQNTHKAVTSHVNTFSNGFSTNVT